MPTTKYKTPYVSEAKPIPRPDCYECGWRRNTPGDAHIRCAHPSISETSAQPIDKLMAIFASVGRVAPVVDDLGAAKLNVRGKQQGIRNGWFNWPHNFDPIWLETCDGWTHYSKVCTLCESSLLCISGALEIKPDDCSPKTWEWRWQRSKLD